MVREISKKTALLEEMTPRLPEEVQIIRDTCDLECLLAKRGVRRSLAVYRVNHRFLGRQAMKIFERVGMSLGDTVDMLGELRR